MGKPFSDVGRKIGDQKGGRLSNKQSDLGPVGICLRDVGHLIGLSRSSNPKQSYLFPGLPFQECHPQTCNDRVVKDVISRSRSSHP